MSGRHRRELTAGQNWTWTLLIGIAYAVASLAYLAVQVSPR